MKTLREYMTECMSVTRINMPQVEDTASFTAYLDSVGVAWSDDITAVHHLRATQSEGFNNDKINSIIDSLETDPDSAADMKPIISSEDGYVLDGHHRFLAAKQLGMMIPIVKVELPLNKLMKLAYEYLSENSD